MRRFSYIYTVLNFIIFVFSLVTNWYGSLIIGLTVLSLLMMLDKLGKGIVLRETMALYISFICLLMPLLGYEFYNSDNTLSRLYFRYMVVPKNVYFDYALPAVAGYILLLCWPLNNPTASDDQLPLQNTVQKIKESLKGNQKIGIYLLILGSIINTFINSLPDSLQYVFTILYLSSFAGFLYVYFSGSFLFKKIILLLFGLFIVSISLTNGMFTIIAYMGMTLFSFFFLGNKTRFWKKIVFFLIGCSFLIVIQNVKPAYRKLVWKSDFRGDKTAVFTDLLMEKMASPSKLVTPEAFFPLYYRANQGYNVALVLKRFPSLQSFDNGDRLSVSIASSFVPRLLWPDKPEAGGTANMKYYAGVTIKGWSTNVGPLSEAYASFGVTGGIIYMMLLGLFIRFAYLKLFLLARKTPILMLWIPVLFYQVIYSAENDTLQVLNSLIKTAFFIFIVYKLFPFLFRPVGISSTENKDDSVKFKQLQTPNHLKL